MANIFINIPVPSSNSAGVAVDVSAMGKTKTITCGGIFSATVNLEFATDDVALVWAPLATFQQSGNVTIDIAAHWIRAVTSDFRSGAANVDVGSSDAGASFALLPGVGTPVDVSASPLFKTVVAPPSFAGNIEISEDGISWAQMFSFQNGGAQSRSAYARFARSGGADVWLGSVRDESSGMSANETKYWQVQAALLDPEAYTWTTGVGVSVTVPADGFGWYATSMYRCVINNSGKYTATLRPCDYRRAILLPEGTDIRSQDTSPPDPAWGFQGLSAMYLYYCAPADVVASDTRYVSDPKGLYFERLARLAALPISEIITDNPVGGAYGQTITTVFPATFDRAIAVGATVYDLPWVILADASGSGPNLMNESNNWQTARFAEAIGAPFKRSVFDRITAISGNFAGNPYIDPWLPIPAPYSGPGSFGSPLNQPGFSSVLYQVLPADW